MSYLGFSKIKNYLELQDMVFSLDIPYQTLEEKFDFELAYQNRFDENFDWKKIERSNEEIKMNMDLGEVVPPGPSNRNQTKDRGKRPRFEPVPPFGEDDGPGRPIRSGTSRYDYNDDIKNYRFRGSMESIEKITLVPAHRNGTILTINLNNPQIWESVISK
ncbi:hypothetical protein KFK09_009399 [Dendrobium nobile]|uniref:Uncharacterized protein n=1 Tax=Dendrobium nobile TaxID=94219 RepID=A0A8T3BJA3_DENNO|nr:hypothetical protein KFK09_009399 [Dendrobium nobile]